MGAYALDVLVRPEIVAVEARRAARRRGKPLLNVGAGTPSSSVRAAALGPTLWGDVNVDIAASEGWPAPDRVTFGDVHRLPWPDGHFGAVVASHVLEHVDDPDAALTELRRVADEVFVIVPKWWAPHTWLHPGHQWFIGGDGGLMPLHRPVRGIESSTVARAELASGAYTKSSTCSSNHSGSSSRRSPHVHRVGARSGTAW